MNELSLFSGAGGGLLGTKLLGWRHVGYVEYERYCQQVIAQRIKDGILSEAPIFGDVREFVKSGAAKKYKGFVDVVTAGFPCQPFSVAGKRKGKEDERNMWPSTIQIIRDVQPRYALLENVPGLLNSGYFQEILGSLAQAGYDAKWIVLGADDVGAPHRRKRLWIKATIPNTGSKRLEGWESSSRESEEHSSSSGSCWWSTEPNVGRVAHGVASRVDRLKAIGNGQVPLVVAQAWEILK
jgi:DNA (cytosine-5)-methyltransferase 1